MSEEPLSSKILVNMDSEGIYLIPIDEFDSQSYEGFGKLVPVEDIKEAVERLKELIRQDDLINKYEMNLVYDYIDEIFGSFDKLRNPSEVSKGK